MPSSKRSRRAAIRRDVAGEMRASDFRRFAETGDSRNVFGAGAAIAFMSAPEKQRLERSIFADVQRAHAFWPVELVCGDREEIDFEFADVDANFARGLHRIAMKINIRFESDAPDFGDGLDGAELVIRVHHGDENGFGAKRAAHILGIDNAVTGDREPGDFDALLFESFDGVEDGVVLDGRADDVLFFAAHRGDEAENGEIVRLRAAAGKYNFGWLCANERGDGLARGFDGTAGVLAGGMNRAGVAVAFSEERQHRVEDFAVDGSGGVVI